MSHRHLLVAPVLVAVLSFVATPARAQAVEEAQAAPVALAQVLTPGVERPFTAEPAPTLAAQAQAVARQETPRLVAPSRQELYTLREPAWFTSVHVATALMQVLDAHSTFKAIDAGAVEANPLLKAVGGNRAAFSAIKAGVAGSLIWGTHSMAKSHPLRALIVAGAVNSVYATIAARNYGIARNQVR